MKQITIIAPIQDGLVARITKSLSDAGINIEYIDAKDVRDRDIVTLTVDRYDDALRTLRDAGYEAFSDDAVIINIKDKPGALAEITQRLYEGGIHMSSIRILYRQYGEAIVAVAMDQPEKGLELTRDLLISKT